MVRSSIIAVLMIAASGCSGPPPPDPPMPELMMITPFSSPTMGEYVLVFGMPGAAPGSVLMTAVDLDLSEPVLESPVAADGSFFIEPRADPGNVVRLFTSEEGRRSTPLDFVVVLGPPMPPPMTDCLIVPTSMDVAVDDVIEIDNTCAEDFVLEDARLRAPAQIAIHASPPINVPASSTVEIEIEILPGGADEMVLLDFGGERRAVGVVGSGP